MVNNLKFIAAADRNGAIGKSSGELLFSIPEDMKRFRELTIGNMIIVGRKTFETFPKGGLDGRKNVVLSRHCSRDKNSENVVFLSDPRDVLKEAQNYSNDAFIAGGGEIYEIFLPFCSYGYLTKIDAEGSGDVFFPELGKEWVRTRVSAQREFNGIKYCFEEYCRC